VETRRQRELREQQEALLAQQPHPQVPEAARLLPLLQQVMQQPPVVPPVAPVVPAVPVAPPVVPLVPPIPPLVPPAGVVAQGPVRVFAITPAHRVRDFLDFDNRNEYQTWMYGIKPLEQDHKFDCREANLKKFLDAYASKEQQMGWDEVFTIPINGVPRHVPKEWGSVTVQQVRDAMELIHQMPTRAHQDSLMTGICLWDSITGDARNKVASYAHLYKINGHDSGPVLLRAIIACTHVDTRAASERVLRDLENLAAVMIKVGSDIEAFNIYVEDKYSELRARAMEDTAAITHLFQGYEAAADETFVAWIKRHHDRVDDGDVDYTTAQIMQMARRKYADLTSNGTWARPNADQEKLIALASDVKKINKAMQKPTPPKTTERAKKPPTTQKPQRPIRPEDEWKYVPPPAGAPQIKMKGAKQYHWCIFHNENKGMWMIHKAGACQPEDGKQSAAKKNKNKDLRTTTQVKPKVKFNAETTTIEEASDSE